MSERNLDLVTSPIQEREVGLRAWGAALASQGLRLPLRKCQSQGQGVELCLGLGGKIASARGHFPWEILNFHQLI